MKIHYFQRYHDKENVATANTMLLLSRLYQYSSDRFFRFLKSEFFSDSFEPEITFNLQEKSTKSVPDATIRQESFKIVVETKMSDWFHSDQLVRHLESFHGEQYKVLLTLAPELMAKDKKQSKGPKDRNSNFQMKNGNSVSKKKEKKQSSTRTTEGKVSASSEKKSLISGISSSIAGATSSISKMLKH